MKDQTRTSSSRGRPALAVISVVLMLAAAACSKRVASDEASMISYGSKTNANEQARLFSVPADQLSHLHVVTVQKTNLRQVLRLPGSVTYNAFVTTPVIAQVNGPVTRILVVPGQHVKQGETLAYVGSADFAQLRSNYLKSRDAFSLADKNYARSKDLYAHHAIAEADLLQAETTRNQAQADLQAAAQALRVLGITEPQSEAEDAPSPEAPIKAPIAGAVVERLVSPGQVLQAGTTQAFTISNMSTVWVLANVYEKDLSYVRTGDPVVVESDAYPDKFEGRISYVAPALDPNTRTLQVRIVTRNPGEKLKKDMFVTVVVDAGEIANALTVPDSAVLRNSENQPFVYVEAAPNQFAQRLVTLGGTADGKTQVLAGLQAGERVVAEGSLFLQFANSLQQ